MTRARSDIIGKRFGRLVCIGVSKESYYDPNGKRHTKYDFRCDCGNIKSIRKGAVQSNRQKSCGCYQKEQCIEQVRKINAKARIRWDNLIGKKFNKLTIVEFCKVNKFHNYIYIIKCECGNEKPMRVSRVVAGIDKSCGCMSATGKPALQNVKYNKRAVRQKALRGLFAPVQQVARTSGKVVNLLD